MTKRFRSRRAATGIAVLTLAGCHGKPAVVALPPPEVSVSQAIERSVTDHFQTTGQIAAVESVDVRARVSGYLVEIGFRDGAEVPKDAPLFLIDPRPYEAEVRRREGELARWDASLRKAGAEVERNRRLLPKGAASERELETAIAARDSAAAEIKSAQANLDQARLDLEFTRVVAPIAGQASRSNVTVGNLVQASATEGNVLTTLVSVDPVYVYFDVDERMLLGQRQRRQERGQALGPDAVRAEELAVEIGTINDSGYPRRGTLDFIDNRVDPRTGTIKARAVLANADRGLTPGLFVRVRIARGEPAPALLVTERAIGTDQGNKFVYVVNDAGVVEYRAVELGTRTDDGLRAVTRGLNAGERVIVNGIQRARPGLTVTAQPVAMLPAAPTAAGAVPTATQPKPGDAVKPHG